jgi:hypothetical protein
MVIEIVFDYDKATKGELAAFEKLLVDFGPKLTSSLKVTFPPYLLSLVRVVMATTSIAPSLAAISGYSHKDVDSGNFKKLFAKENIVKMRNVKEGNYALIATTMRAARLWKALEYGITIPVDDKIRNIYKKMGNPLTKATTSVTFRPANIIRRTLNRHRNQIRKELEQRAALVLKNLASR